MMWQPSGMTHGRVGNDVVYGGKLTWHCTNQLDGAMWTYQKVPCGTPLV